MAFQHFYSRVPARMSMFRKCDSFDTFAKSGEITKEYINGNLHKICVYKPTEEELDYILQDKLPPVYCASFSKDGEDLIHSKFSFVSSDYTGERPSWLCHSLVLSKNEHEQIATSPNTAILNRENFKTSLDDFNLNDKAARPVADYPELEYRNAVVSELSQWAEGFDETILKKIIFAVMNVAASNQKNVYICLAKTLEHLSESALDFINRLMLVFPAAVRRKISFITEYNDALPTKNYKIRFITGNIVELCANRGYVIDTGRKITYGIFEDDFSAARDETDFLYGLLSDGAARAEFLAFYEKAVNARRDTSFNLKTFNDLIYLFRFICGKYIENEIVPDDAAVLKMLTNYEKYRETLKTDDRRKIISVIGRYSENRRAIPQAVFAKLGKIYPSEPESCKSTAMTVILDLLHTNIMRDKLFAFISATYDGECAESRGIICEDLSRVFYGGFLQPDILEFYGKHFGEESENVKEIILEKLLMTIRTESIQKTILEFIDKYQAPMSPQLKRMIYHTFYEMLPENDTLSKRIIPVLGRCMASDDEPTQLEVFAHICELITADEAKGNGENALLEICLSGVRNGLPLGNMLLKKAFCGQNDEEFFETVANAFLGGSLVSIGNALKLLWDIIPEPTGAAYELFYGKVSSLIPSVTQKNDLFDLLDFDKKMRDALAANFSGIGNKFYGALYPTVLTPIIGTKLSDAFNVGRNKCGLRAVLAYAEADENLKFLPGAQAIREVIAAAELVKQEKYEKALETLMNIPLYMESGKMVSETLKAEFKHIDDGATGDIYRDAVIGAMYSYLENGKILLGGIFSRCLERKRTYDLYNNPVKPKATAKDIQDADSRAAMTVFGFIVQLCVAVCGMECSREVKEALCVNPDSEFDKLASRILSSSTKKSKDLFGEIYDYALHGSLRVARKLENAAVNTDKCPRAFKKLF